MVYEHDGKKYIRIGECNRCGECCIGWAKPCQYLKYENGKGHYTCLIHDKLSSDWSNEEHKKGNIPCNPRGSIAFPDGPQSQENYIIRSKCGYSFIEVEKILVACPTFDGKEYCMERFIQSIKSLDYPNYEILLVDTSNTIDFYERWKDKIPMVHIETPKYREYKIQQGEEWIRKYFVKGDYARWFNVDSDVIVPPETINILLQYGKDFDWVSHSYPDKVHAEDRVSGFGCSLFSRKLMTNETMEDMPNNTAVDGWFWHNKVKAKNKYKSIEFWELLKLEHLDG